MLGDTRAAVIAQAKAAGIDMPILMDYEQFAGEQLQVTRAAEVIVINPNGWHIVYRGPVGQAAGAISGLVAGEPVAPSSHPVTGGLIAFPDRAKAASFLADFLRARHRADHRREVHQLPRKGRHRSYAAE